MRDKPHGFPLPHDREDRGASALGPRLPHPPLASSCFPEEPHPLVAGISFRHDPGE